MNFPHAQHRRFPSILRIIRARPRLGISILVGLIASAFLSLSSFSPITKAIISWDVRAIFYLILVAIMMFSNDQNKINMRAHIEDEGSVLILVLIVIASLLTLAAIVFELSGIKNLEASVRVSRIALAVLTIATSWFFMHTMFAVHYAHDFYKALTRSGEGGLLFPNEKQPDYLDFLYFALIIGTSAQTADVAFTSKAMRRTGSLHCVLAFFFNTTLLALTINIASGFINS